MNKLVQTFFVLVMLYCMSAVFSLGQDISGRTRTEPSLRLTILLVDKPKSICTTRDLTFEFRVRNTGKRAFALDSSLVTANVYVRAGKSVAGGDSNGYNRLQRDFTLSPPHYTITPKFILLRPNETYRAKAKFDITGLELDTFDYFSIQSGYFGSGVGSFRNRGAVMGSFKSDANLVDLELCRKR